MARTPGSSSLLIYRFTAEEIEVANILVSLKSLIPPYDSCNLVPLTPPCWVISKRPRSASALPAVPSSTKSRPDRPTGNSAAVPGEGNRRNAIPDSPLLLKSSQESCCLQGSSKPTRNKKRRKNQGHPVPDGCKKDDNGDGAGDVDDSAGIIKSKKKPKKVNDNESIFLDGHQRNEENQVPESDLPLQIDLTLTLAGQPHGAHTSPASRRASRTQIQFDLNLLPESPEDQPVPPDV